MKQLKLPGFWGQQEHSDSDEQEESPTPLWEQRGNKKEFWSGVISRDEMGIKPIEPLDIADGLLELL
jgi:hypothetical protein